ncbi:hypothetical protein LTWDN19_20750 (plasmid) [Latilactobacillus curvatus]|uniref:YcaO domain-containing protein n=1 Tax=Latilactobacillus curvatus TaxID=28038 RepID=A0ABN6GN70_LATCU|nr:YcaO-like family protein [Latilactobacillus curvatus]BCX31508.1 hypothetical protein LTWDN19_20750 [Latilactobacillus curvatus]
MKVLNFKESIDWDLVDKETNTGDIIVNIPQYFIGFKQNNDVLSKLNNMIDSMKNNNSNHWLSFFYDANFNTVRKSIEESINPQISNMTLLKDVSLISNGGEILDDINLLDTSFVDKADYIDVNNFMFGNKHKFKDRKTFRVLNSQEVGKSAGEFLTRKTLGRYHLDPACSPFVGVAYEYKTPTYKQFNYGYGRAFDFKTAKNLANLEAVERYASEFYAYDFSKKTKYGSYKTLKSSGINVINPNRFTLEEKSKVTNQTEMFWTQGQALKDGTQVWIPEDLVVYGNNPSRKNYIRNINDSSNGVALGSNYTESMICALLELIERHSFLAVWYGGLKGRRVSNAKDFLDEDKRRVVEDLENENIELNFFEISVIENVFVVWGLVKNNGKNATMATYTSAGAGFSLKDALDAAVTEVVVGYRVQANYHEHFPNIPRKIKTIDDHIEYYGNPKNENEFEFIKEFSTEVFNTQEPNIFDQYKSQEDLLNWLVTQKLNEFEDIYFVNLTSEKMAEHNLFVVKALIPGMLPMTFGSQSLRINVDTINKLRSSRSMSKISNIIPRAHPFP